MRSFCITARARNLPALTIGITWEAVPVTNWISPPTAPIVAGPPPLYGTWVVLILATWENSSPARWSAPPTPEEP